MRSLTYTFSTLEVTYYTSYLSQYGLPNPREVTLCQLLIQLKHPERRGMSSVALGMTKYLVRLEEGQVAMKCEVMNIFVGIFDTETTLLLREW